MNSKGPLRLSQLAGETITVAGSTYRLSLLTVADLAELKAWVLAKLPDPIETARRLAAALRLRLIEGGRGRARAGERSDRNPEINGTKAGSGSTPLNRGPRVTS